MKRLFISHASEDKNAFVRPLARALFGRNLDIWYDEYELGPGDSIREGIDKGLVKCDIGLCVFSHAYFRKKWTKDELGGIFAKESCAGRNAIIPVWYNISKEDLISYSPILADRIAILDDQSIDVIASKIIHEIRSRHTNDGSQEVDIEHRYFNPPNDIPQLGYRFDSGLGYNTVIGMLRPRERLFAFWQHRLGHFCACHIGSEARFLEVAEDAETTFYAVDQEKVELGIDRPFCNN